MKKTAVIVKGVISLLVIITFTLSIIGAFGLLANSASPSMKKLHIMWSFAFSGVVILHILLNLKLYTLELSMFSKNSQDKLKELSKKFPVFFKGAKPGVLKFKAILTTLLLIAFIMTFLTGIGLFVAIKNKAMMNPNWSFLGMSKKALDSQHTFWGLFMFGIAIIHFTMNYKVFLREISMMFGKGQQMPQQKQGMISKQ